MIFNGAHLRGSEGRALTADALSVGGSLMLRGGFRAEGMVQLRSVRIASRLYLDSARLHNPGDIAIRLSRAEIGSDFFCRDMRVNGELRLAGFSVAGRADLSGVRLHHPGGAALLGQFIQVREFDLTPAEVVGRLVLAHARVGVLRDDKAARAAEAELGGLTYETLEPRLPAVERLAWLSRDTRAYDPQPYEQLAMIYERLGDQAEARRVMLRRERLRRRTLTPLGRAWGVLQDATVAYGYQTWRAALWLGLLVTIGTVAYAAHPPVALRSDEVPHFNPFGYTLDLLIPFVDLGQEGAFNPAGPWQWLSYVLIASGWVLVTTIAAGAARVLSHR